MTYADLIAGAFWPFVLLSVALFKTIREPTARLWIARLALAFGFVYFILWILYQDSSLIAVVDFYLVTAMLGCVLVWGGFRKLSASEPVSGQGKAFAMILVGAVLALGMGCFLFMDLALPRNVLEGRAENVRIERGFRTRERFVDIAGRSVRVTEPVYQRMKLHPVVRAEVGRGTRYVYKIDYLTN